MRADYVITESGGYQVPTADGTRLPIMVEEKGTFWSNITVHGTPSHASQAYRTDNALVTAAEVVRRIAEYRPEAQIGDTWRRYVEGLGLPAEMADPDSTVDAHIAGAAARPRSHRALVHAHDDGADGRARRHEDEHHPGPRRPRRSTCAPCPASRATWRERC